MADEDSIPKRVKPFFVHSSALEATTLDEDVKMDGAETLLELLQIPMLNEDNGLVTCLPVPCQQPRVASDPKT